MYAKKKLLGIAVSLALAGMAASAQAVVWTQPIVGGEVLFDDWNYSGPNGRDAMDFSSVGGFNGPRQIQRVVTNAADGVTPDAPQTLWEDFFQSPESAPDPKYKDARMDSMTNFYAWGYSSPAGSTFSNMQIDADGDYFIARNDMAFNFYGDINYVNQGTSTTTPDGVYSTNIGFQPYALSDAKGWCGSVTASNPGALEAMAGQVEFDFGFEAFLPFNPSTAPGTGAMQIVRNFQMRSYGTLTVQVSVANGGSGDFNFNASAVVNNTNPGVNPTTGAGMVSTPVLNVDGTPALDEFGQPRFMMVEDKSVGAGGTDINSYNEVSFMGGGIVEPFVWVILADANLPASNDNIVAVLDEDEFGNPIVPIDPDTGLPIAGDLVHYQNSFANYPFLLRADGVRILEAMDFSLYNDTSNVPAGALDGVQDLAAVPVPAAVWLFGSGLIGLVGVARRRRA